MSEVRVYSWPFDSAWAGYDDEGYPVYDRAVKSDILQDTFREFFTDGVFPSNKDALNIRKNTEQFAVDIAPGAFIIDGAIGVVPEEGVTIPIERGNGTIAYGIFLRKDDRITGRSCYIVTRAGTAGTNPQPPAPDNSTPGVKEYRLGYVTIPTNAIDMSAAFITNEKGFNVCPYAAPFATIDVDAIYNDARAVATEYLEKLLEYFEANKDLVDSALDDTTAGYLQQQISEIQKQLSGISLDLTDEVDDKTIEYTTDSSNSLDTHAKLRVKDGGITSNKLADGAVTSGKISDGAITADLLPLLPLEGYNSVYERVVAYNGINPVFSVTDYNSGTATIPYTNARYVYAPNYTSIGYVNNESLQYLSVPNASSMANQAFANAKNLKAFDFSNFTSVPSSAFSGQNMSVYNISHLSFGQTAFRNVDFLNETHWDTLAGTVNFNSIFSSCGWRSAVYFDNIIELVFGTGNRFYSSVYAPNLYSLSGRFDPDDLVSFPSLRNITGTTSIFMRSNASIDFPYISDCTSLQFCLLSENATNQIIRLGSSLSIETGKFRAALVSVGYSQTAKCVLSVYFESKKPYSSNNANGIIYGAQFSNTSAYVDLYFPSSLYTTYRNYSWYSSAALANRIRFFSF